MSFVYIMSNKSMPGLIKIGYSKDVRARSKELYAHSGVPSKFTVEYAGECLDPARVEQAAHRHFKSTRINNRREYFRVKVEKAVAFIENHPQFIERNYCKKDWIANLKAEKREQAEQRRRVEQRRQRDLEAAEKAIQIRNSLIAEMDRRNAALEKRKSQVRYRLTENNILELGPVEKGERRGLTVGRAAKIAGTALAAAFFGA